MLSRPVPPASDHDVAEYGGPGAESEKQYRRTKLFGYPFPSTELSKVPPMYRRICYVLALVAFVALLASIGPDMRTKPRISLADMAADDLEAVLGNKTAHEEGFTLVVPTYKRVETLPDFMENYASGKIPSLRRVVFLWNDIDTEPPRSLLRSAHDLPVPVVFEQRQVNSLNERFRRTENIRTECVLSVDDDIYIQPDDVEAGFQAWRQFGQGRRRMVGYFPRAMASDGAYLWENVKSYSMVLTKSAFFHVDWMDAYWSSNAQMTSLRAYVDELNNCEDLLMAVFQSHHTRLGPVYFKAPFRDIGLEHGISTQQNHLGTRADCVKKFLDAFGKDTLIPSSLVVNVIE